MSSILATAPKYFRAQSSGAGRVDPTGGKYGFGVIYGVSLATRGEALGHGMWLDQQFVDSIAPAANSVNGLKSRFTHPSMSGDGLGTQLGKMFNARLENGRPVADLHFIESSRNSPQGDLGAYVMQLATDAPNDFGMSIVFEPDQNATQEFTAANTVDGQFKSPDPQNVGNLPHARMARLIAADAVDEPAANPNGMFSAHFEIPMAADAALMYAMGLSAERPESLFGIDPDRLRGFVSRCFAQHGLTVSPKGATMPESKEVAPVADAGAVLKQFASDLAKYRKAFGNENGCEWFQAGFSWSEAVELHAEELQKQLAAKDQVIADLNARIASMKTGEEQPASFSEAPVVPTKEKAKSLSEGLASRIRIAGSN